MRKRALTVHQAIGDWFCRLQNISRNCQSSRHEENRLSNRFTLSGAAAHGQQTGTFALGDDKHTKPGERASVVADKAPGAW